MARLPVREIRRMELEKAAYLCITKRGVKGFNLDAVAKQAGTAKGTIHHYFLNKEELFEGVARYGNREFGQTAIALIKAARSPSDRVWSIISLYFDDKLFHPTISRAYVFALTIGIRYKRVLRIYDATHARTISNLAFALRQLVKPEDVRPMANTIWAIMEGAWLLQATEDRNIAKPTLRILAGYLKTAVPGFDSSVIQLRPTDEH
jgi:TetR/AcrR family transcriptional regulator, transcriptional repressor of bet genes